MTSGASKEANKEVAKDPNVDLSTRATAAKDAVGDKMDEHKHAVSLILNHTLTILILSLQTSAEGNKQRATH